VKTGGWWPYWVGLLVSICIIVLTGWWSGAIPAHAEYCYESGETHQEHCATYHVALIALWQVGKALDRAAAGIAALAAVAIAWFTWTLYRATNKLWEAGERQLAIAKQSADTADRSLRELNRAFVFPVDVSRRSNPITPDDTDVIVMWENSGATQTKALRSRISSASFPPHKLDGFNFPDLGAHKESRAFIGPKASIEMAPITIPQATIASAGGRSSRIFVWGWAEYDDIFPGTVRHRTEFCVEMRVSYPTGSQSRIDWVTHTEFNGSEEECGQRFKDAQKRRPAGGQRRTRVVMRPAPLAPTRRTTD
jgi:hypothetical protein